MMEVTLQFDVSDFRQALGEYIKGTMHATWDTVEELGERAKEEMIAAAPYKTGHLRQVMREDLTVSDIKVVRGEATVTVTSTSKKVQVLDTKFGFISEGIEETRKAVPEIAAKVFARHHIPMVISG